ncbi:hypothetical protein [Candidatus Tokpelaia sp.]|uniref:hypothetical protein n=1 Tax=Candidatus Tokpelaia sp. TaxID=2233777 RepID=UPI00123A8C96|nr:hypothetical protein [Candidatus Tokpelaia sp.]KAA6404557.1 hypothetical protein DPQ22_09260 [Candidatus Tokpelaia sp.]
MGEKWNAKEQKHAVPQKFCAIAGFICKVQGEFWGRNSVRITNSAFAAVAFEAQRQKQGNG